MDDLESIDARIESLLAQLGSLPDRRALAWAEDLVRALTDLYGEGMRRVLSVVPDSVLDGLAGDDLVAALLTLHGLHPIDLRQRVDSALETLPRMLGIEDVRVIDADDELGVVKVRLLLTPGLGRSRSTVIELVRRTVEDAVPDATSVEVDCPETGSPVRLGQTRGASVPISGPAGD